MENPLEATSPNPRRSAKIVEALQKMPTPLELPSDPDAQATVTDFLDFTEYLPADVCRSLTLIGDLDVRQRDASASVHKLTQTYGALPAPSAGSPRPDAVSLRASIGQHLIQATGARTLAHTEACRMQRNVDRHYARAQTILTKLQAMVDAFPPDRAPTPPPSSAAHKKKASPLRTRGPKITLRTEHARLGTVPRITVPGEVLAPYEIDLDSAGSDSERESIVATPATAVSKPFVPGRIKLKVNTSRLPLSPAPPPTITPVPTPAPTPAPKPIALLSSTSALAKLSPPPSDAKPGSVHAPWLQLTDYELATVRKRMKKNSVWTPNQTMINRELEIRGRSMEDYLKAKAEAEAKGLPFTAIESSQLDDRTAEEAPVSATASKLRKGKREQQAGELAKLAEREAQESARRMAETAQMIEGIFNKHDVGGVAPSSKKRKRDSEPASAVSVSTYDPRVARSSKRTKTGSALTPQPPPIRTNVLPGKSAYSAISTNSNAIISASTDRSTHFNSPILPPKMMASPRVSKTTTPILPPEHRRMTRTDIKRDQLRPETDRDLAPRGKRIDDTETAAGSRPRRATTQVASPLAPPPLPRLDTRRPSSSRTQATPIDSALITATATIDRPRRASAALSINTPDSAVPRTHKRTKKPAPGVPTNIIDASSAVRVGKRTGAPRKKAVPKGSGGGDASALHEVYDEIDEDGTLIDPAEPRYCHCHRVSFGEMICCESPEVSIPLALQFVTDADSVPTSGIISIASASRRRPRALQSGTVQSVGCVWALVKRARSRRAGSGGSWVEHCTRHVYREVI